MDVTGEMAAEEVPEVDVDIPEEDAESIRADGGFGHSAEAHEARSKPSPRRPSSEAIEAHYRTHCPFRSWCPVQVAEKIRTSARRAVPPRMGCPSYPWIMN